MADEYLGVCTIVLNENKTHFLAGKRKNCYGAGYYGVPGGRIDFGELVTKAALREAKEETGIE